MVDKLKEEPECYIMGLNLLSYFHWFRGEYEKGFNLIFESLRNPNNTSLYNVAWNYFALAVFYFDTKDYDNSRINYQKAYDLFVKANYPYGLARAANGLATVAIYQNRFADAEPLLQYAVEYLANLRRHPLRFERFPAPGMFQWN